MFKNIDEILTKELKVIELPDIMPIVPIGKFKETEFTNKDKNKPRTKTCVACGGSGVASNGQICYPCRGSGQTPDINPPKEPITEVITDKTQYLLESPTKKPNKIKELRERGFKTGVCPECIVLHSENYQHLFIQLSKSYIIKLCHDGTWEYIPQHVKEGINDIPF